MHILKKAIFIINIISCCILFKMDTADCALKNKSERPWYIPDFFAVQSAGYIGYVAAGIGFFSPKRFWEGSIFYGYVPKSIGGRRISTIALKNSIFPLKFSIFNNFKIYPFYFGFTVLGVLDKKPYWYYSTDAPDWYYRSSGGIHAVLNLGIQLSIKDYANLTHGFYAELTMLDSYLKAYFDDDNFRHPPLYECISLALGYKTIF